VRGWLSACLLAAVLPLAAQAQDKGPSEAERLLFDHEHFAAASQPGVLRYRYIEETPGKLAISDQAVLTLTRDAQGRCCDVHGDYLSGAPAVSLPDIAAARSNPVVLYFLEGEVRRLQRTTGGQAAHFRRQFRQAIANTATVTDSNVSWGGRTVPARTVRVAPFLDDPFRARFADQAETVYTFVLSDAVPGGVLEMSATLPGAGAPAARRLLTFQEAKP
jgi:hypothetical protein